MAWHVGHRRGFRGEPYDAMIQLRCKRTTLATIAKHLIKNEIFFDSRSSLARLGLELAEKLIVSHEGAVPVTSISDATEWLGKFGIPSESLNTGRHSLHAYVRELQQENANYERGAYKDEGITTEGLEPEPTTISKKKKREELSLEQQNAWDELEQERIAKHEQDSRTRKVALGEIPTNVPLEEPHEDEWPKDDGETENDAEQK